MDAPEIGNWSYTPFRITRGVTPVAYLRRTHRSVYLRYKKARYTQSTFDPLCFLFCNFFTRLSSVQRRQLLFHCDKIVQKIKMLKHRFFVRSVKQAELLSRGHTRHYLSPSLRSNNCLIRSIQAGRGSNMGWLTIWSVCCSIRKISSIPSCFLFTKWWVRPR